MTAMAQNSTSVTDGSGLRDLSLQEWQSLSGRFEEIGDRYLKLDTRDHAAATVERMKVDRAANRLFKNAKSQGRFSSLMEDLAELEGQDSDTIGQLNFSELVGPCSLMTRYRPDLFFWNEWELQELCASGKVERANCYALEQGANNSAVFAQFLEDRLYEESSEDNEGRVCRQNAILGQTEITTGNQNCIDELSSTQCTSQARMAVVASRIPKRGMVPLAFAKRLNISTSTLGRRADEANVRRPQRGQKAKPYSLKDMQKIVNVLISKSPRDLETATQVLREIEAAMQSVD